MVSSTTKTLNLPDTISAESDATPTRRSTGETKGAFSQSENHHLGLVYIKSPAEQKESV